jgi:cell division septum initiation protein DivIVA
MSVDETVLAVRRELQDSSGSLALLQSAADAGDFAALKEITKTMDQSLRKRVVGQAKYYWSDQELATQLSNNITFDLIGINRNTRAGQENAAGVQQYLDDLRQDLTTILVETEKAALLAASGG